MLERTHTHTDTHTHGPTDTNTNTCTGARTCNIILRYASWYLWIYALWHSSWKDYSFIAISI